MSLPYWSPNARFKEKDHNQLTPSAQEFIPGASLSFSAAHEHEHDNAASVGMNATASEWRPTSTPGGQTQSQTEAFPRPVEVQYGDSSFYVPEDIAYAYEETMSGVLPTPADEAAMLSLDWTSGQPSSEPFVATVPAPPKRTLQTIGLPDPLRKHFQSLDFESLRQVSPDDDRYKEIPQRYHSVAALDADLSTRSTGGSFGYPSALYKVCSRLSGSVFLPSLCKRLLFLPLSLPPSLPP